MGYLAYQVKVPQLMKALQSRDLLVIRGKQETPAQYLMAVSRIAQGTAYQVVDEQEAHKTSMDSLWKIYVGLREAGITILEDGEERPIRFDGDIYEEIEVD